MPVCAQDALRCRQDAGYRMLAIEPPAVAVEELPTLHADAFDRILVAQVVEPMRPMVRDARLARHGDTMIEV